MAIVYSTNGMSGRDMFCESLNRSCRSSPSGVSTRYRLPASEPVICCACVRISSSSVWRSRSVESAMPIRVSSLISRVRNAASWRARAVSARAVASRYAARSATSIWRGPWPCGTNAATRSSANSSGTSCSSGIPMATTAPPLLTKLRSLSGVYSTRLEGSRISAVGTPATASSPGEASGCTATPSAARAPEIASGVNVLECSSVYFIAPGPCCPRPYCLPPEGVG